MAPKQPMSAEDYRPALTRMATRLLGGEQDAAAVVNDTIATVLLATGESKPATLRTKLYRTLRQRCSNARRNRQRYERNLVPLDESIPTCEGADPYRERDDARAIAQAIERLPLEDQDIVRGYYWEDKSLRELGSELGMSHEGIKYRLKRALAAMRGDLMSWYLQRMFSEQRDRLEGV